MAPAEDSVYESAHKGDFDKVREKVDENYELIKKTDNNCRTLLHWAANSGNIKLVSYLIELGSEIDAVDDTEFTPLILAASAGRTEVVELLIEKQADVNHKASHGHSSLQYAASKGWLEICAMLLENKADINVADIRGATPLHRAASKGNLDVVKLLLTRKDKLNLDPIDAYGDTPLHLACEEDRQSEAILLVESGARTDIINKSEKTALDLCSRGLARALTQLCKK